MKNRERERERERERLGKKIEKGREGVVEGKGKMKVRKREVNERGE